MSTNFTKVSARPRRRRQEQCEPAASNARRMAGNAHHLVWHLHGAADILRTRKRHPACECVDSATGLDHAKVEGLSRVGREGRKRDRDGHGECNLQQCFPEHVHFPSLSPSTDGMETLQSNLSFVNGIAG
jgi:hypothetical protein